MIIFRVNIITCKFIGYKYVTLRPRGLLAEIKNRKVRVQLVGTRTNFNFRLLDFENLKFEDSINTYRSHSVLVGPLSTLHLFFIYRNFHMHHTPTT